MTASVRPSASDGSPALPGVDPRAVRLCGPAGEGVGYLLGAGLLLTSAELVGTAPSTVTFQLPGAVRPWRCAMLWHRYNLTRPRAARLDTVLLRVLDEDWDERRIPSRPPPPRWGKLATRRPSVPVSLTAFPGGNALVIHGTVSAESAVKVGRYHVTLPGSMSQTGPEPWPGVAGAAVLCHGLILGVVADGGREPGTAWLSVVPSEILLRDSGFRALAALGPLRAAELQPVLEEGPTPPQGPQRGEADSLTQWCEGRNPFSLRLVVGADDDHRRRLASALLQQMSDRDWATGFLASDVDERALDVIGDTSVPLLLAVDRADTRLDTLLALLDTVARRAFAGPSTRFRLLLLAADEGEWWWEARGESPALRDLPADTVLKLPSPS
jgi:hypothetical protein